MTLTPRSHALDRAMPQREACLATTVYTSWEDLHALREQWDTLLSRSPADDVFSTFDFLEAWSLSRTREATPHVIVVRDGSSLVGIAPLMFCRRKFAGVSLRSLEFIGTPSSDYSDLICAHPSALDGLWPHVMDAAAKADVLYLQQIRETSPTYRALTSVPRIEVRPCTVGLSAALPECGAPLEAYIKGTGLRARTLRRIEKEGAVGLLVYDSPEEIKAHLPTLFSQHVRRWSGTDTPSFFNRPEVRQLYLNWTEHLPGKVLLGVLTLNGLPIASVFGFAYGSRFVFHTISFEPDYRKYHCGLVCIVKLMQSLRARGIESVDFTRGAEAFKTYFADVRTISYEGIYARTAKAKFVMKLFLAAKDTAASHRPLELLARKFGFMPSRVHKVDGREN